MTSTPLSARTDQESAPSAVARVTPHERPVQLPRWARDASNAVDLGDLTERVVEADLAAAFPSLRDNAEFVAHLRASVAENLHHLRQVIGDRARLADIEIVEPFALAGLQARLRLPQTALQRSYRVGFQAMLHEWTDRLVEHAERHSVPREEALQALRDLTSLLLGYQHHVASRVADTFARTDDAMSRSRVHVRNGLVRHLLREDATPLPPSDLVLLDYPLEASHVTVLLPSMPEGAARQILTPLRAAAHTRDTLVHPVDLSATLLWLAQPRPQGWRPGAVTDLVACLNALGVEALVSEPHVGLSGVQRGWRQVQDVRRVREAWAPDARPRVLSHSDVSLEILLMADPESARAFVAAELGGLSGDDDLAVRLRETVEASYRWGRHVTAAAHLHLHEHTVRNRLHKASELLGRPLTERRTELQVALRLARLLSQKPD